MASVIRHDQANAEHYGGSVFLVFSLLIFGAIAWAVYDTGAWTGIDATRSFDERLEHQPGSNRGSHEVSAN